MLVLLLLLFMSSFLSQCSLPEARVSNQQESSRSSANIESQESEEEDDTYDEFADTNDEDDRKDSKRRRSSKNLSAGESFFKKKVLGFIKESSSPRCLNCHATKDKLKGPGIQGPLDIYEYDHMKGLLQEGGEFADDNYLFNKFMGKLPHTGDRICRGAESELCKIILDWWGLEFGGSSLSDLGRIVDVSATGLVSGYAQDITDPDADLDVRVYFIDGDNKVELDTVKNDDRVHTGGGVYVSHGFKVQIPENFIDNAEHEVEAYVVDGDKEDIIARLEYVAYKPRGQNNVQGFSNLGVSGCGGCHSGGFPYAELWKSLVYPSPADGGSPTNNAMYEISQPGSQRATNHSGGAQGNPGAIIQWWCSEFDPGGQTAGCS